MLDKAITKIQEQQEKVKGTPAYWVGEQLKDMLRAEPWNADLVANDLDAPEMAITEVEKKLEAFAKANKKGNMGFCSPLQADKIIREFYGFRPNPETTEPTAEPPAEQSATPAPQPRKRKHIRLEDFL